MSRILPVSLLAAVIGVGLAPGEAAAQSRVEVALRNHLQAIDEATRFSRQPALGWHTGYPPRGSLWNVSRNGLGGPIGVGALPQRPVIEIPPTPHQVGLGGGTLGGAHGVNGVHGVNGIVQPGFGSFTRTPALAIELEQFANDLCLDLYYNYSHNPGFIATYTNAYRIFETAAFIHAAGRSCDRAAVRAKLCGLDDLFAEVRTQIDCWTCHPVRPIGTLCMERRLARLCETIDCLMHDAGVLPHQPGGLGTPLGGVGPGIAPPPAALQPGGSPLPSGPQLPLSPGL